jgi:hypothetical protein
MAYSAHARTMGHRDAPHPPPRPNGITRRPALAQSIHCPAKLSTALWAAVGAERDELRSLLDTMGLPTDPVDGLNLQG